MIGEFCILDKNTIVIHKKLTFQVLFYTNHIEFVNSYFFSNIWHTLKIQNELNMICDCYTDKVIKFVGTGEIKLIDITTDATGGDMEENQFLAYY